MTQMSEFYYYRTFSRPAAASTDGRHRAPRDRGDGVDVGFSFSLTSFGGLNMYRMSEIFILVTTQAFLFSTLHVGWCTWPDGVHVGWSCWKITRET